MAHKAGEQTLIRWCPICMGAIVNIDRKDMKANLKRNDGHFPDENHIYECLVCRTRFEINQDR